MRAKIIACETVGEELKSLMPEGMPYSFLKFGLHCWPEELHATLQEEIDKTEEDVDTILLGYGMCSKGALGLCARGFRLVVPRVDDCIALFLGSKKAATRKRMASAISAYPFKNPLTDCATPELPNGIIDRRAR